MLPGIGSRLAEKIVEIMETGSMTKLEEYQTDADIAAMDLFGKIWGIGPSQAKRWVDQVADRSLALQFVHFPLFRAIEHWMIYEQKRNYRIIK